MISRSWTVTAQTEGDPVAKVIATYKGFNKTIDSQADILAVVCCDGDMELFALDDTKGHPAAELVRYLAEQEVGHVRIMGIFNRVK